MNTKSIDNLLMHTSQVEAERFLSARKIEYRVVREDGLSYVITDDYCPERANLEIKSGIVVGISWG